MAVNELGRHGAAQSVPVEYLGRLGVLLAQLFNGHGSGFGNVCKHEDRHGSGGPAADFDRVGHAFLNAHFSI